MVYPNDQNLKKLVLFYLLTSVPRQPAGKVQSFGLEGWGYSEGVQIKANFSLFSFVSVSVCVCAKYFWLRETISPVAFFEKVWVSRFFLLMQCKSGSLYFLHKLLNETAKVPGWELRPFLCALR